ncbi:YitT family protein [Peptococcaceae bacterium 1198_IL3148]
MKKLIFYILQYSWLLLGLFLYGAAIVLLLQARLGLTPWDVLHQGLTQYLPFTLGQVMIGVGAILVAITWLLGVKPGIGSILNMILIGVFVDQIIIWGLFPAPEAMGYRILYLVVGVLCCGLATGVYITANLGSGPRDSLMLALHNITGWRIGPVRTVIEVTVVIVGYLLGGLLGIGTLVFSLTIGWATEFFLTFFHKIGKTEVFVGFVNGLLEVKEPTIQQRKSA